MMVVGGEVFGRYLCHERGALMDGTSAFIKEAPERSLGASTMWQKGGQLHPGRGLSPEPAHAGTLILDFQSPGLRNKFLLFIATQSVVVGA